MASELAKPQPETQLNSSENAKRIRVIIADTQAIFRVGIRKVLAVEDDLRVVAQAENLGQAFSAIAKFPADVLLLEARMCANAPEAAAEVLKRAPELRIIVVTADVDADQTVEYLRRGVRGIVSRSIAADLLLRCVRKVADGETWLDNRGVNWVIEAYRSQASLLTGPRPKNQLSEKEMLIISCVAQGMRNKEIAQEVGTTEQVIKNYLRKIYDKLGVSDRLELALYCIHHRLMDKANTVNGAADHAASVAVPANAASSEVQ
jgi:DNA-binding NarL/FixJ family response regulator